MTRRGGLLLAGGLLSLLLVAVLIGLSDLGELTARARGLDWTWAGVSAALALASYACIAATQGALLSLLGARVPKWHLLRSCLAAVVVARTLRSGGTSGLAFLALALSRRGVPVVVTVAMGVGNLLVNACVAAVLLATGIVLLLLRPGAVGTSSALAYALMATILGSGILCAWILLTRDGLRRSVLRRIAGLAERAGVRFKRPGWGGRLLAGGEKISTAARGLMRHPGQAWRAWAWSVARLVASVLSLAAALRAVGLELPVASVLISFIAMKMAGSLAFVPAGLGVVDGSLAGMLTLQGVPYEAALLVAALHRVTYHVVPAVVAMILAGPLLLELSRGSGPPAGAGGEATTERDEATGSDKSGGADGAPDPPRGPGPSDAPSTEAPAVASSGDAPSAVAPSAVAPSGDAPSAVAPSADAPSAVAPSGEAPPDEAPPEDAPDSDEARGIRNGARGPD